MVPLLLFFSSYSFGATDQWNTAEHFHENKGSASFQAYLTGAGNAYLTVNVMLTAKGQKPLYCQPDLLALDSMNYLDIAEKAIPNARRIYGELYNSLPIESLLLQGLHSTFPCGGQ
jgi:hypothetical protein